MGRRVPGASPPEALRYNRPATSSLLLNYAWILFIVVGIVASYLIRWGISLLFPNLTAFMPYNWTKLERDMSRRDVIRVLGEPDAKNSGLWCYLVKSSGEEGAVVFFGNDGRVTDWREPGALEIHNL